MRSTSTSASATERAGTVKTYLEDGHLPELRDQPINGGSAGRIAAVVHALASSSRQKAQERWLGAVTRLVCDMRPELSEELIEHLGSSPADTSPLAGLSMGEVGAVYEGLLALSDRHSRKTNGQYFTPDDVAAFMASRAVQFPQGTWIDPCCGVGNLAYHLALRMPDPSEFVARRLALVDIDPVALLTAQALLVARFASSRHPDALRDLAGRSQDRDFLAESPLPVHDFVIVNPPYAATGHDDRFETGGARELYCYFLERSLVGARGIVAITPSSFLTGTRYKPLREILGRLPGGEVFVFDNVPDTCFRGYKFGSTNTSKTNFVRAAVTVSGPQNSGWKITPIVRWARDSRTRMWGAVSRLLLPLRLGPAGEWAKVMPGTENLWDILGKAQLRLGDLISDTPTGYRLDVASTPRYYISATKRSLDRSSKHTLFFSSNHDMNLAYVVLNSSLAYWWWRCVGGGITLTRKTLRSIPVPSGVSTPPELLRALNKSESVDLVVKANAGRTNENVRRPRELTLWADRAVMRDVPVDAVNFDRIYAADMFSMSEES